MKTQESENRVWTWKILKARKKSPADPPFCFSKIQRAPETLKCGLTTSDSPGIYSASSVLQRQPALSTEQLMGSQALLVHSSRLGLATPIKRIPLFDIFNSIISCPLENLAYFRLMVTAKDGHSAESTVWDWTWLTVEIGFVFLLYIPF